MPILASKGGHGVLLNVGQMGPLGWVHNPALADGIQHIEGCEPYNFSRATDSHLMLSEGAAYPHVTIGTNFCYLSCKYCLNLISQEGYHTARYATHPDSLQKLLAWISQSSRYQLRWAVGEALSPQGRNLLQKIDAQSTENVREHCNSFVLQTNGIPLKSRAFDNSLMRAWPHRRLFWTFALLQDHAESHRSVEQYDELLLQIAENFAEVSWPKGIRIILPSHLDLRKLPEELIAKAMQILKIARPDMIEPFYICHLDPEAVKVHHTQYYPNIPSFCWMMEQAGVLPDAKEFARSFSKFAYNRGHLKLYNKIRQTDAEGVFELPDVAFQLDLKQLGTYPFKDYAAWLLKYNHKVITEVPGLCLKCDAMPCCMAMQRPEIHFANGCGPEAHLQYRDNVCNLTYQYALMLLRTPVRVG